MHPAEKQDSSSRAASRASALRRLAERRQASAKQSPAHADASTQQQAAGAVRMKPEVCATSRSRPPGASARQPGAPPQEPQQPATALSGSNPRSRQPVSSAAATGVKPPSAAPARHRPVAPGRAASDVAVPQPEQQREGRARSVSLHTAPRHAADPVVDLRVHKQHSSSASGSTQQPALSKRLRTASPQPAMSQQELADAVARSPAAKRYQQVRDSTASPPELPVAATAALKGRQASGADALPASASKPPLSGAGRTSPMRGSSPSRAAVQDRAAPVRYECMMNAITHL